MAAVGVDRLNKFPPQKAGEKKACTTKFIGACSSFFIRGGGQCSAEGPRAGCSVFTVEEVGSLTAGCICSHGEATTAFYLQLVLGGPHQPYTYTCNDLCAVGLLVNMAWLHVSPLHYTRCYRCDGVMRMSRGVQYSRRPILQRTKGLCVCVCPSSCTDASVLLRLPALLLLATQAHSCCVLLLHSFTRATRACCWRLGESETDEIKELVTFLFLDVPKGSKKPTARSTRSNHTAVAARDGQFSTRPFFARRLFMHRSRGASPAWLLLLAC
jgi:hypothetical protein